MIWKWDFERIWYFDILKWFGNDLILILIKIWNDILFWSIKYHFKIYNHGYTSLCAIWFPCDCFDTHLEFESVARGERLLQLYATLVTFTLLVAWFTLIWTFLWYRLFLVNRWFNGSLKDGRSQASFKLLYISITVHLSWFTLYKYVCPDLSVLCFTLRSVQPKSHNFGFTFRS